MLARTIVDVNGCFVWTGATVGNGYGTLSHEGKDWRANRLMATFIHGEPPPGMYALHSCDNPRCINPDHLRWGTPAENSREMADKNRAAKELKNGNAKLSDAQVAEIRELYRTGLTQVRLAAMFKVHQTLISLLVNNKTRKA